MKEGGAVRWSGGQVVRWSGGQVVRRSGGQRWFEVERGEEDWIGS